MTKMHPVDQFACKLVNYTSRFNYTQSQSYAPQNITGRYVIYPSYGDFPDTYFLVCINSTKTVLIDFSYYNFQRSYGKWWINRVAHQIDYMPQDKDPLAAEDYITVR